MAEQKIKDWPENERPTERLIKYGAESLSDAQLLAIILRTGGKKGVLGLSLSLLDTFKNLRNIDSASIAELSSIKGIGKAKIAQIKAALELGKRLMAETSELQPSFSSSLTVYSYFAPRFKNIKKEQFFSLLLDAKNKLIKEHKISEGSLERATVHPREAFKEAIRESASSIIFIHNHPSGDPSPSGDDLSLTERLKSAGDILGIRVLDHIIVGDGRYISMKEKGFL
jgi:DNA repair protein RadC